MFSDHEHNCSIHYHARAKCDCALSFSPRGGAIRAKNADGLLVQANPGDNLYSSVMMIAQEYFDGEIWKQI